MMNILTYSWRKSRTCLLFLFTFLAFALFKCNIPKGLSNPVDSFAPPIPQPKGLILTEAKKSLAPIILPENHTLFMKEAANDLADYIQKISGAKPKVLIGVPAPFPEKAIWVGYQPAVSKLFPKVDFNYKFPEEVINAANENHIILSGHDVWNPEYMSMPDRYGKKMIMGIQQEYGTCNAVYTFIQDQLKVRWLWPGTDGEDIIENDKIIIEPFFFRYHPVIKDRRGILHLTMLGNTKGKNEEHDWSRMQRMQLSSLNLDSRHAFRDWWAKYGKTHPEFFALLPTGKREPKFSPEDVKLCQSNPGVWDAWLNQVEEALKENPNMTNFSAAANDGWSQGHCTCPNCRAWDAPGFTWEKPVLSDRDVTFANMLAKKLKERYPGKAYKVLIMGYGYTRPAPTIVKPAENVLVLSVSNFLQRGDGFEDTRTLAMQQYHDWGQKTLNLAWRPNLGNPAGLSVGMPDVAPHQASGDIKYVVQNNCIGLFFDSYWNHWSTQGIQYYTLAQLSWNPWLNVDSLLDDYFQRAYGPAAPEMKNYWSLMEETRNELLDKVKTSMRFYRAGEVYSKNWFEKADNILKNANAKIINAPPKYGRRIYFAQCGLEYAKLVIDTRKKMEAWEKNKTDSISRKAVLDNWTKTRELITKFPKYAINLNKVFTQSKASTMKGLHPDNPLNKKTESRIQSIPGYE